mmetsp:Transcript_20309/g.40633  ORF Transcript_20309/g.40633 Transcript_20309/m.40633 type:complete len:301 (+) Transcript_20309:80-982(+)|eukprot:CAMPEP_0182486436 /NCGR_PEP_ID=MMETSP1319-20130603/47076_1 /TAXON_ID=172717 /ORGANISM="Bolidomonas pacifica, Strain RCC208" /LENGTH=300 /DNA_ID=CAMNT_0024688517 /DNA_START=330 /DNA_END=1232 /DNA_ORIENTATION=+
MKFNAIFALCLGSASASASGLSFSPFGHGKERRLDEDATPPAYHCQAGGEETQCLAGDNAFCAIPHDTDSHRLRRRKLFGGVEEKWGYCADPKCMESHQEFYDMNAAGLFHEDNGSPVQVARDQGLCDDGRGDSLLTHGNAHCSGLDLERIQAFYDLSCNCPEYDPSDPNLLCSLKQWTNPTCQQGIRAVSMGDILRGNPTLSYEEASGMYDAYLQYAPCSCGTQGGQPYSETGPDGDQNLHGWSLLSSCLETDMCKHELVSAWTFWVLLEDPYRGTPEAVGAELGAEFANICMQAAGGS